MRIINCARGGIIDEHALFRALAGGQVAGAAMDVFHEEPPTESPLLTLPQVLGSPHIGANTQEAESRIGDEIADLLIDLHGSATGMPKQRRDANDFPMAQSCESM